MRAFYLVGFAGAAIVGAGAFAFGCSSSSDNTTPADASVHDTGVTTDDGGDSAVACMPIPVNIATFDSGSDSWACYQSMCASALTECHNDCPCSNAVLGALSCAADAGPSGAFTCFATNLATLTDTAGMDLVSCLMGHPACSGGVLTDAGVKSDAGPKSDAGASDGGTPDAAPKADGGDAG